MAPAPAAGHRLLPERESLRGQLARSGVARVRGAGPSGDPYLAPAAEVRAHRGRSHQQRERRARAAQRLPQHGYRADEAVEQLARGAHVADETDLGELELQL